MIQDLGKGMETKTEKMQEVFTKDLEELKNKQTDEQYTRRDKQWDNWGRRMEKWPGGQNGGNHCHRTEYRKRNEKKWRQPERPLEKH